MAIVLILAAVVVVLALVGREAARSQDGVRATPTRPASGGRQRQQAPVAVEIEAPVTRLASGGRQAVAGEHYYTRQIARFVGRRHVAGAGDWEAGLRTPAYLRREPTNRHDRNAVQVLLPHDGATVLAGYLPAVDAPRWQPLLRRIEAAGRVAECSAAVYRDRRGDGYQVVLRVANPEDAEFANAEPDGATLLPAERQCAVTGEKGHQDALAPYRGHGLVWATLHTTTVARGKYAGEPTIEVRIDGRTVGSLTAAQGKRYAAVLGRGAVVACEARVYEGANYLEAQVMLPKVD